MNLRKARTREARRISSALGVSYTQAIFIATEFTAKSGPDQLQQATLLRAQYTGEPLRAAQAGLANDGTLGLDTCTPEQRKLRSVLAVALFNRDIGSVGNLLDCGLHMILGIGITVRMSPQRNRLVAITDDPYEAAAWLFRTGLGFRLEEFRSCETYVCHHLPTGAQLVIASDAEWERREPQPCPHNYPGVDVPIGIESLRAAAIPTMSTDAEQLLAGLPSRTDLRDPSSKWALGNWSRDPLNPALHPWYGLQSRSLSGHANKWRLDTNGGVPYIDDIAYSLTADPIGIPGATCRDDGDHFIVRLGSATLELVGQRRPPRTENDLLPHAAAEQGSNR